MAVMAMMAMAPALTMIMVIVIVIVVMSMAMAVPMVMPMAMSLAMVLVTISLVIILISLPGSGISQLRSKENGEAYAENLDLSFDEHRTSPIPQSCGLAPLANASATPVTLTRLLIFVQIRTILTSPPVSRRHWSPGCVAGAFPCYRRQGEAPASPNHIFPMRLGRTVFSA
jgi:hypothetical protein